MEYWFTELGYFAEEVCKSLQEEFDGVTYFNIKVKYSNCAGNCTLGIESNAKNMKEDKRASRMFLAVVVNRLFEKNRESRIKCIGKVK